MATPIPKNDAAFTLAEVAAATSGEILMPSQSVSGVAIDSRRVGEGGLFVAIQGASLDGHRFVGAAVAAGAAAVLVQQDVIVPPGVGVVRVGDTTRALGMLARSHRRRWGGRVVGITGSAGKTSTKELCAAALASEGLCVLATVGNLNNLWGVPMTLLQLAARHDIAVIEMGTNQPGEIAKLAEMAEPQIGLLTMVSEAHTEGLGGLDGVLHEKAALFRALPVDGCAVTTGDDARCAQAARDSTADRVLLFGRTPSNDVVVLEQGFTQSLGTRARIRVSPGHGELEVNLMMPGEPAAMNAAAAVAVALGAGIGLESAGDALSRVPSAPGRMQVEEIGGRTVLDDSYNANPRSTSAAIKTLSGVARVRAARAVAFLGDMKELGAISLRAHTQIIAEAIEAQVDVFVGCGAEMGEAIIATAPRGEAGMNLHAMSDSVSAAGRVGEWTQPGDVVLVKGSRSMRMETIIDALRGMECAAP